MPKNGIADQIDPLADFASKAQIAKKFKRSPRTIDRWVRFRNFPPPLKLGNLVIFHVPSIEKFLADKCAASARNRQMD